MNFLHSFFPTLLKLPGFLLEFITPIVKVWGQLGRRAGQEGYEDRIAKEGGRGVRGEKESGSVRRAGQRDRLAGGGGESSREGEGQAGRHLNCSTVSPVESVCFPVRLHVPGPSFSTYNSPLPGHLSPLPGYQEHPGAHLLHNARVRVMEGQPGWLHQGLAHQVL